MIGIDIVHIPRIEKILEKKAELFLNKVFSSNELEDLRKRNFSPEMIAGRYAAKEAISKATGLGIGKMGLKKIQIHRQESGGVYGQWRGAFFNVSISHDGGYAIAIASKSGKLEILPEMLEFFPKPKLDDHKGDRGKVAIIAGSPGMYGSALLSSKAAMRMGCGYTYLLSEPSSYADLSLRSTEVIVRLFENLSLEEEFLESVDAIGIGPGIGKTKLSEKRLISCLKSNKPLVVDADGLSLLKDHIDLLKVRKNFTILTPHLGEMAMLLGMNSIDIQSNRISIVKSIAKSYKSILVLKGRDTVVSDGEDVYINKTGNPGMATAGSGDVLTGIITSLLSQDLDGMSAAKLGVYLHGLSGDLAIVDKSMNGLIASDLIEYLPKVLINFYGKLEER